MPEKERAGRLSARSLTLNGALMPKVAGGTASITGTGTVTLAGFAAVTSVVATLNQNADLFGTTVTATSSGNVITLKVWKPTATGDATPIASASAKSVNYVATGS
jgi:hypothetical protein